MSSSPALALAIALLTALTLSALADPLETPAERLDVELDRLESRVIHRRERASRTSDLLTKQDLRIAERRFNTLKTRTPRNARIPLLGRQLDRLRRPIR